jgi:hypothetical protein
MTMFTIRPVLMLHLDQVSQASRLQGDTHARLDVFGGSPFQREDVEVERSRQRLDGETMSWRNSDRAPPDGVEEDRRNNLGFRRDHSGDEQPQ